MTDPQTVKTESLVTFDEGDVEVVSAKTQTTSGRSGVLNADKDKLAGAQNAQNYQKN